MKKLGLAILLLTLGSISGSAQWVDISNPSLGNILDCKFVSPTTGWLINLSNTPPQGMLRTTNGGQSWAKVLDHPPGVFNWLADFDFLNDSLGYATALNGQRFRTFNGGLTWDTLSSLELHLLRDDDRAFKIFSRQLAYSYGFVRSIDTFRTWQQISSLPPDFNIRRVFYVNADTMTLGGGATSLSTEWTGTMECYRSIDSGFTWQRTFFDSMFAVEALAYTDTRIGYAFSYLHQDSVARVITLKTTNAGATWFGIPARLSGNQGLHVFDAYFQNPDVGFVSGNNGLARTTDGGMTWERVSSVVGTFVSMSWPDSIHGWVVGYDGKIYRTTNGGGLPIQLTSFTGIHVGETRVLLDWRTISEINNYGFHVMRRQENEPTFTQISPLIPGHGTTNEPQHYSWTDSNATTARWYYKLLQIDLDGTQHYTEPILVDVTTSVSEGRLPVEFRLEQNYPNPFNPTTTIKYQLPDNGLVSLKVFNTLGQEVATLVNELQWAGSYSVSFDGSKLSSGVYLYTLKAGSFTTSKRMIIIK